MTKEDIQKKIEEIRKVQKQVEVMYHQFSGQINLLESLLVEEEKINVK